MTWRDRVLDTGEDRDAWLASRSSIIGASDAAGYVKPGSVDKYELAKLKSARSTFSGNRYTESGNLWEPRLLAYAGIEGNKSLIHAPGNPGFAATPDGIEERPDGLWLAECKAKHDKVVTGPDAKEWRQMAWQLHCVPEAAGVVFVWGEIVGGELRPGNPQHLMVPRDHPKIVAAIDLIVPIATEVLARITSVLKAEKESLF
ncbi:hypothetical protein [Mycetocola saprophilus]|uniref:hypothetical protein n=1 Tax=Mycetocola saprophilus TaxID=76636 RepID=UPI003BF3EDE9